MPDDMPDLTAPEVLQHAFSTLQEHLPLHGAGYAGTTLEGCRRGLHEALSDWIALRLGLPMPIVGGIDQNQHTQPV